ncbi:MAG: 16S rRNA (uracil(1498)-N(3))-methyltransferase [Bacteroidales bacterium]|nr:16S rRNA (uracil(1498)-N(3))-methyltransferase [Bacteroidales bacterium]
MELFYSKNISKGDCSLNAEESNHCIKVLRHKRGDVIHIVDGVGTLYECEIIDTSSKELEFKILKKQDNFGTHSYKLHMAVAPPKNIDRFEWFVEKATEIGVDEITPVIGDYSERKVFKPDRIERLLVSASKQSHKGAIPVLNEAISVKDFILKSDVMPSNTKKLICYCDEIDSMDGGKKILISDALKGVKNAAILIGPEGDFSRMEINLALKNGWEVVSLGESRLRIETAALTAVVSLYLENL